MKTDEEVMEMNIMENRKVMAATMMLAGCLTLGAAGLAVAQDTGTPGEETNKADQAKSATTNTTTGESAKGPAIVLVPVVFAADANLADGCWARLYDSENYKGNMLTLVGPVDIPRTRPMALTGFEFGANYDSVAVGPKATLRLLDEADYRDQAATIASGQKVADMDTRMGHLEDIESLKISCKA